MNPPRDHERDPSEGPIEDLVQEILDRPADDPRRQELLRAIARHRDALAELRSTAEPLDELRAPLDAPDLTGRILHAAHARRRFLPARLRRWVDRGRIATAAGLLLLLGVVATIDRLWPGATDLTPEPRALSAIPRAFQHDASQSAAFVTSGVRRAGEALAPVVPPAHPADPPDDAEHLTAWVLSVVGPDGSVYDTVMTFNPAATSEPALRVYHAPRAEQPSGVLFPFPREHTLVPQPQRDPLP